MTFTGIPPAALDFYEDLENDNSKGYWPKPHNIRHGRPVLHTEQMRCRPQGRREWFVAVLWTFLALTWIVQLGWLSWRDDKHSWRWLRECLLVMDLAVLAAVALVYLAKVARSRYRRYSHEDASR